MQAEGKQVRNGAVFLIDDRRMSVLMTVVFFSGRTGRAICVPVRQPVVSEGCISR